LATSSEPGLTLGWFFSRTPSLNETNYHLIAISSEPEMFSSFYNSVAFLTGETIKHARKPIDPFEKSHQHRLD
jgi:hypothetical protein